MTRKTLGTRVFKLLRAAEETRSNCISGLRASFEYFFRKYVVILDGVLQGGTSFKGTFRTWKYHFQQFWIDWTFVNWNVTDQRSGITKSNPIFGLFWKSSKRWNIYEQKSDTTSTDTDSVFIDIHHKRPRISLAGGHNSVLWTTWSLVVW